MNLSNHSINDRSKIKLLIAALILSTVLEPVAVGAKENCKGNPRVVGSCFTVRGRLALYQGYPDIRMWWVGTNRIFGIAGGEGEEIIPDEISEHIKDGIYIFGDYEVCLISEHVQGHMQWICIESGTRIRIEKWGR